MKIALICRPFSFHGGVETATAGLLSALVRRGEHDIHLITTRSQPKVDGITVRPLPILGQPSVLRQLSFALQARRAVRSGGYDLVHSHERCLVQDVYRAGEGSHRAYLDAMGRTGLQVNPHHRLLLWLEERIFTLVSARHVIAISGQGKEEIQRLYKTPARAVTTVYNGVDLDRFHPDNRGRWRAEMRVALGISEDAWLIVFIGSGFERKGLGPLIEGLASLRDRRARLLVAGRGRTEPYRLLAERLGVSDSVRWSAPRPDVERLYAASDVLALPALYEPFGNVHLEALASGLPVLTSRGAGGAEAVVPGESGAVVDKPEAAAIASGLGALLHADARKLSAAARAAALPFTFDAQVERLAGLWQSLRR
jgi:UDP-glucose:(heptosyl)LPS alpha-1,3-glucosyltransferase